MRRSGAHAKIITVTPDAPESASIERGPQGTAAAARRRRALPRRPHAEQRQKQASRHDDGPHEAPRRRARARRRDFDRGAARDGRGLRGIKQAESYVIPRVIARPSRTSAPSRRHHRVDGVECLRFEISTQVVALHSAFGRKSEADGTPCTMRGNWARLFAQMDEDRSGRLDYDEFRKAVAALGVEVAVSDLDALWAYVEADGSGEATIKEFQDATYLLMIDGWPVLDKQEKRALVFELNRLVETRHERKAFYDTEGAPTNDSAPEQRFNWFKMFNILDVDGSGRLGFEELESVIRAPYPCLCTPEEVLPLEQIKALWKAIDADSSGDVTVDEFMGFMRSYGPTLAEVAAMKRDAMLKKRAKERTRRFGTADEKQALGEARSPARRGFSPARAAGGPRRPASARRPT